MRRKITQLAALVLFGVLSMQTMTFAIEKGMMRTIIEKLLPGVYIKASAPVATDAVNTWDGGEGGVMSSGTIPPVPPDPPPPPPDD